MKTNNHAPLPSSFANLHNVEPEEAFRTVLSSMRLLPVSRWEKFKEYLGLGVYRQTTDATFEELYRLFSASAAHQDAAYSLVANKDLPESMRDALHQVIRAWNKGASAKFTQENPVDSPLYSIQLVRSTKKIT